MDLMYGGEEILLGKKQRTQIDQRPRGSHDAEF